MARGSGDPVMLPRPKRPMTPRFDPHARLDQFPILRVLRERVLVFDGGMGTQIQSASQTPSRLTSGQCAAM